MYILFQIDNGPSSWATTDSIIISRHWISGNCYLTQSKQFKKNLNFLSKILSTFKFKIDQTVWVHSFLNLESAKLRIFHQKVFIELSDNNWISRVNQAVAVHQTLILPLENYLWAACPGKQIRTDYANTLDNLELLQMSLL